MNVVTNMDEFPPLASLSISPDLQALLEFDDRLRTSGESYERPGTLLPADLARPGGQYPSWVQQEVPTVSLPPPQRKKSVIPGVPISPRTTSEFQNAASPTNSFHGVGKFGGLGEMMFARPRDAPEELESEGSMNPYLNSPPSPPRYFYPRSDDEEDQPSPLYTLEKSRSTRRQIRRRSFSDQHGSQLVSPRYFASLGRSSGSRPKEKGASQVLNCLFPLSHIRLQSLGTTCSSDEAVALAQPQGFSILLSLSSGPSPPPHAFDQS